MEGDGVVCENVLTGYACKELSLKNSLLLECLYQCI